jgi:hypothetical protein
MSNFLWNVNRPERIDPVYGFQKPRPQSAELLQQQELATVLSDEKQLSSSKQWENEMLSPEEMRIQEEANNLLSTITYKWPERVVLAQLPKKSEDWTATVWAPTILDFPPENIRVVNKAWENFQLKKGYTYLVAVPFLNENSTEDIYMDKEYSFLEIELPWVGSLLMKNMIFQGKLPETWEAVDGMLKKYKNVLL